MVRNQHRSTGLPKYQNRGNRVAVFLGSILYAVMAASVAQGGETEAPNPGELDREVTREVTNNEDGSKTVTRSGTVTNIKSGETATFDSSRTVTKSETGREWTSEGSRTTFDGETISSSVSGAVVRGEGVVSTTQQRTVTNETTGEVRSRSSDIVKTKTDDGIQIVGTRTRTGPDGEIVSRDIDRTRPPRTDRMNARPVRPTLARSLRPARVERVARRPRQARPE